MRAQLTELKDATAQLQNRLSAVEGRLNHVDSQTSEIKASVDTLVGNSRIRRVGVPHAPSDGAGTRVGAETAATDSEAGFVNDDAVQSYRKAMVLFDAKKYSEAVLGFSSFLDKYPDHPLAGGAQYYVGESYFREGQFRLALQEFHRVLTSYDRSSHVADTLRDLAAAEDELKMPEEAARHRQLLSSLFPQSPATDAAARPQQQPAAMKDSAKTAAAAEATAAATAGASVGANAASVPALDAPPAPATPDAAAEGPRAAPPTAPMAGAAGGAEDGKAPKKAE